MRPLDGIRVLDLSKVLAGPLCGQSLGDLGADVVKVEPVGAGDDLRSWPPQRDGVSAIFFSVNRNKRSLALDMKSDAGRAVVHALARRADVVIQGFGGGTAERLGVDYATLSALNPRLIYVEVSGYGRTGPLGDQPGYDVMLQAFSGMLSTMGQRGGPFARASFSPVDLATGMNAFAGVLAALLERGRTGRGTYVDVSLLDSSIALMSYLAQNYWWSGKVPGPMGTGHGSLAPYQAFRASDGHLMLGVGNDAQWRRFCPIAGLEAQMDDPRFATSAERVRNFDATVELVQAAIAKRPVAEWLAALRAAGVPCSPIHTLDEALAHPQVASRELIAEVDHPSVGRAKVVGLPIRFESDGRAARNALLHPPPRLGEHSEAVLREAGFDDADIAALVAAGVVGRID